MKKILAILLLIAGNALGATYYVKPTGNDANSGLSEGLAWQHVQKACTTVVAGDTCFIRSGTYSENSPSTWDYEGNGTYNCGLMPCTGPGNNGSTARDGTPGNEIVFKGYPGDVRPIILGIAGARSPAQVSGCDYLVFDSLEFRFGARGVWTTDSRYLTVRYCVMDSTSSTFSNNGGFGCQTSGDPAPTHILVEHCEMFRNTDDAASYGMSHNSGGIFIYECDTCEFAYNTIHDEAYGFRSKNVGGTQDSINIHHNTFYNILEHGTSFSGGGGGCNNVAIHHNTYWNCGTSAFGPSLSGGLGYNIRCYNNTVDATGAVMGGFTCGGNHATGSGWDSTQVFNNIFYMTPNSGDIYYAISFPSATSARTYEDYNLYYSTADDTPFFWAGTKYTLTTWRAATPANVVVPHGQNSTEGNPLFTDPTNHNYTPQPGSPALTGGRGGAWPSYRGAIGTGAPTTTGYLSIGDVTVTEGGSAVFSVALTAAQASNLSFSYATSAGTATGGTSCTAGIDYVIAIGTRTITTGQTSTTITVPTCDDATVEAQEQFYVVISSPSISTVVISDNTGQCNLNDNDLAPSPGNKRVDIKGKIRIAGKVRVGSKP